MRETHGYNDNSEITLWKHNNNNRIVNGLPVVCDSFL
jgi:hypothetical protein